MEKFRKATEGIKRAFVSIEQKLDKFCRRYSLRTKEHEYWARGSGLVHVPKDRLNEIPRVIGEYHEGLHRTDEFRTRIGK